MALLRCLNTLEWAYICFTRSRPSAFEERGQGRLLLGQFSLNMSCRFRSVADGFILRKLQSIRNYSVLGVQLCYPIRLMEF